MLYGKTVAANREKRDIKGTDARSDAGTTTTTTTIRQFDKETELELTSSVSFVPRGSRGVSSSPTPTTTRTPLVSATLTLPRRTVTSVVSSRTLSTMPAGEFGVYGLELGNGTLGGLRSGGIRRRNRTRGQ